MVGTADKVQTWVAEELAKRNSTIPFDVASNPEFLKEGSAVDDFMRPDRVVIGVSSERAEKILRDLYSPFIRNGLRIYTMDIRSAEMTKYAANSMLATKISFINEIANICEHVGADVRQVRQGVGADGRIGMQFLHPGVGYGGSCFPKDVRALVRTAEANGYDAQLLDTVDQINKRQKTLIWRKIQAWADYNKRIDELTNSRHLGISFKPNTDDTRESPALDLIKVLLENGATIRANDPKAIEETKHVLGNLANVTYHDDPMETCENADILCLMTEWRPYRRPDFAALATMLKAKTIFDGRNQYDTDYLRIELNSYGCIAPPPAGVVAAFSVLKRISHVMHQIR